MAEKLKLGTIEEEAAACRLAFAGVEIGACVLHCHHESLFEYLSAPAEERITFILLNKTTAEQALRLHLFRPVPNSVLESVQPELDAEWERVYAERKRVDAEWKRVDAELIEKLHPKLCPNCPWDGRTIFPEQASV